MVIGIAAECSYTNIGEIISSILFPPHCDCSSGSQVHVLHPDVVSCQCDQLVYAVVVSTFYQKSIFLFQWCLSGSILNIILA